MELTAGAWLALTGGVLAGAGLQAATGFGFAIVAAPVFLAVLNATVAVPILVALHVVQSAMVVPRVWHQVPRQTLMRMGLGAAVGCPLGVLAFQFLDVRQLKLATALLILLAAVLFFLRGRQASQLPKEPAGSPSNPGDATGGSQLEQWATGLASGGLTAVLVMPGPPLMVHLMRSSLGASAARALSLTLFAACYVAVLAMYIWSGDMSREAWAAVSLLAPGVILGTLAGQRLAGLLPERHFRPVLLVLLVAAGIGAFASAL